MTTPIQESVWKQRVPPDPPAPPPILPAFLDSFLGSGGSGGSNLCRVNLIRPNCMKVRACPKSTALTAPLDVAQSLHVFLVSTIRTVRLVGRSLLFALGEGRASTTVPPARTHRFFRAIFHCAFKMRRIHRHLQSEIPGK